MLAALGIRFDQLEGRFRAPGEVAIRRSWSRRTGRYRSAGPAHPLAKGWDGETDEITQFALLLRQLGLVGFMGTVGAYISSASMLGTEQNADYILVVRGHRPSLRIRLRKLS